MILWSNLNTETTGDKLIKGEKVMEKQAIVGSLGVVGSIKRRLFKSPHAICLPTLIL